MSWRRRFGTDTWFESIEWRLQMWGAKDATSDSTDAFIVFRSDFEGRIDDVQGRLGLWFRVSMEEGLGWPPVEVTLMPARLYLYAGSDVEEAVHVFERFAWAFWSEDDPPPDGVVHGAGGLRAALAGAYGKEPSEEIDVALDRAEELGRRVYFVRSYEGPWAVVYGRKDPEVPLPAAGPLYYAAGKLIRRVANAIPGPRRR